MRAVSAARTEPLATGSKTVVPERLREGAVDTALNSVAILREMWRDFGRTDRFFKVKAGILATWVLLSAASFWVACPAASVSEGGNALGATLVAEPTRNEYMVKNDGSEPWANVIVRVNGSYTLAVPSVAPGGSIVFGPKQLFGKDGELAPADLRVQDLDISTPDDTVALMRLGRPRE